MKYQFLTIVLMLTFGLSYAQSLETIKKYHDPYTRTNVNEVYTVLKNTNTKHGEYKSYDSKGHLTQKGSYKEGAQDGKWVTYYGVALASLRNDYQNWIDKVKEVANYSGGKRHGTRIGYKYPNGKRVIEFEKEYANGDLVKETTYWENGQKQSFVQINGVCRSWNENGVKIVEYTTNEMSEIEGAYQEWYDDGNKYVIAHYENGNLVGDCKQWFPDGTVQIDQHYSTKSILTKNLEFYSSGKPKSEMNCENSKCKETLYDSLTDQKIAEVEFVFLEEHGNVKFYRDGEEVNYYKNGKLKSKGLNKANERVGEWIFYDKNGDVEYFEVENQYGGRTKKTPQEIEAEKLAEQKRVEEENRRKLALEQEKELKKNKSTYTDRLKNLESLYDLQLKEEVILLGEVVSEEKYVAKNKKWLYEAFKVLDTKYQEDLNEADSDSLKNDVFKQRIDLANRMIELFKEETKSLEKSLKKVDDPEEVKGILGL